jgi:hypothetical protein
MEFSFLSVDSLGDLTAQRDTLAAQIRPALNEAAFNDRPLNEQLAKDWIAQAQDLLAQSQALGDENGSH